MNAGHLDFEIAPADPLQDKEVLALAAQAWSDEERASLWGEIRRAAQTDPDTVILIAARRGGQLSAAALAHILPGRAAVVWPPQFAVATPNLVEFPVAKLLGELTSRLAARGTQLAQAVLAVGDNLESARLAAGGFWQAANLLYLCGEAERFPTQPPKLPFELRPAASLSEAELVALIDRTYEKSLDCPWIDGQRTTTDVLRGHYAVGEYRPELWQIAIAKEPVGCLFVNLHPDVRHAELVYLGVTPQARGRGFGKALTQQAMWLARQADCDRLVLAVDLANEPAIRAYYAAGLKTWDRRAIWCHSLGRAQA